MISPSTAARDRGIKLECYRLYGVAEYWVVDPDERTIEAWDLAGAATEPAVNGNGETLRWTPLGADATLEVGLAELFEAE